MNILAVDTAGKTLGVALLQDDRLLYECYLDAGMTHSETLMPLIDNCLKLCGMGCKDIDLYGVNAGPGSFTGLRIGLAAVKGLAFPRETLCAPVSTLEALAAAHTGSGTVLCALDARRAQVYSAAFDLETHERLMDDDARAVAESTFRELDAMRSAQNEENDHQRINAARAEMRRKLNETQDSLRKDEPAPEEKKSARAVQVGDVVQIRSMGVKATVLAISSDRTLTLQAGILRVTAREDEGLLLENEKPAVTVRTESRGTALRQSAVSSELDIRGMETIEAIPVVERYIDSAVQSRLETVTIIHGKGTGALRAAVQQSLRRNKQVKSFRLGRYGEGETGVTVVELK